MHFTSMSLARGFSRCVCTYSQLKQYQNRAAARGLLLVNYITAQQVWDAMPQADAVQHTTQMHTHYAHANMSLSTG